MLYIFQHIPKTAGTTFTQGYLATAFGEHLEIVPGFGAENHAALHRLATAPLDSAERTQVIAGHGTASLRGLMPSGRHLTLVREPVARLISAHRHYLRTPEAGRDAEAPSDFLDFALDERFRDVQARTLLGNHYNDVDRLDDAELECLLAERFFLIGQSEMLPRFLYALSLMAEFPLVLFADRLRTSKDWPAASPAMLECICHFHRRDIRVCALASRVFETQTAGLWTAQARRETEIYEAALEAFGDHPDSDNGQAWMPAPAVGPIACVDLADLFSNDAWRPATATPTCGGGARVITGPAAWSYAAILRLPEAIATMREPLFLRVDLRVDHGRVGLALCSGEDRTLVSESYFERIRADATGVVPIRSVLAKPALLVRNGSLSGPSAVEIKKVSLLASPLT